MTVVPTASDLVATSDLAVTLPLYSQVISSCILFKYRYSKPDILAWICKGIESIVASLTKRNQVIKVVIWFVGIVTAIAINMMNSHSLLFDTTYLASMIISFERLPSVAIICALARCSTGEFLVSFKALLASHSIKCSFATTIAKSKSASLFAPLLATLSLNCKVEFAKRFINHCLFATLDTFAFFYLVSAALLSKLVSTIRALFTLSLFALRRLLTTGCTKSKLSQFVIVFFAYATNKFRALLTKKLVLSSWLDAFDTNSFLFFDCDSLFRCWHFYTPFGRLYHIMPNRSRDVT